MDKVFETTLLYDFYGELLTEHQRDVFEDYIHGDLSLGEISENRGISRQGVFDIVRRCKKLLFSYEEKLHLVRKFMYISETVSKISDMADDILRENADRSIILESASGIKDGARSILKQL